MFKTSSCSQPQSAPNVYFFLLRLHVKRLTSYPTKRFHHLEVVWSQQRRVLLKRPCWLTCLSLFNPESGQSFIFSVSSIFLIWRQPDWHFSSSVEQWWCWHTHTHTVAGPLFDQPSKLIINCKPSSCVHALMSGARSRCFTKMSVCVYMLIIVNVCVFGVWTTACVSVLENAMIDVQRPGL